MRSPFPSFRRADRLIVAAVLVASACGSGAPGTSSEGDGQDAAPDRVIVGPQGKVGQFVVECDFDRFRADDPVVHPDAIGASHLHQFFGAIGVTAESSLDELLVGDTTCDQSADTASYWAPALVGVDGEPVEPVGSVAYYRAGPGVDPTSVVAYPAGFMAVAGDHTAVEPQPVSVVAWTCGSGGVRSTEPVPCGSSSLRMIVTFQDCWDGEHVRSPVVADPDLHVAYSTAGVCPATHPVSIPQLQFAIDFPAVEREDLDEMMLASGNIYTGHADFWNGWDQVKLTNEVTRCINRDLVCGLSG